MLNKDKLYS
jgi:hypothetical protein